MFQSKIKRGLNRMSLMKAPTAWLNELAKGTIKTQWGEIMKAENPNKETLKIILPEVMLKSARVWIIFKV